MLNIVLHEPEIPQNTGNIVRTCVLTGARLHLIKPLGFSIEDKYLKRAGLDYWQDAQVNVYENLDDFFKKNKGHFYFSTTKANKAHSDIKFKDECYIFFGKETKGLPESLLYKNYETSFRIPMIDRGRSLNLSNSVAIVSYEYFRQRDYKGLTKEGHLREY